MNPIGVIRARHGWSQRTFAKKATLSFRGLQLMEEPDHDWRLSSIRKVAGALDLPVNGVDELLTRFLQQDKNSVVMASIRMDADGFPSWPLHLFNFVDAFRSSPSESLVKAPPVDWLNRNLTCLLASTVETLCADLNVSLPEWCYGIHPLREPWFVAGIESLKAMALVESPVRFRKRNIFVLANFLDRV